MQHISNQEYRLSLIGLIILLSFNNFLLAAVPTNKLTESVFAPSVNTDVDFDPQAANKQLDQLSIKLSIQNLNRTDLENAVEFLNKLKQKASLCVEQNNQALQKLTATTNNTQPSDPKETSELQTYQSYLANRKQLLNDRLASCQLFILRANEAINAFSHTAQNLAADALFQNQANIWISLQQLRQIPQELHHQFDWQQLYTNIGFEQIYQSKYNWLLLVMALLGGWLGYQGQRLIQKRLPHLNTQLFAYTVLHSLLRVCQRYLLLLLVLSGTIAALSLIFLAPAAPSSLQQLILGFILLIGYNMIVELFFAPPQPAQPIIPLPYGLLPLLKKRLMLFGKILLLGYIVTILFNSPSLSETTRQLFSSLYLTGLALHLIRTLWLMNKIAIAQKKVWPKFLYLTLGGLLIAIIAANWLGHTPLAWFILIRAILTLLAIMLIWTSHLLVISGFDTLSGTQAQWQQSFRQHIGLKKTVAIPELIWLRLVLILLVWTGAIWLLLKIWQLPVTDLDRFLDAMITGFTISDLSIVPSRIVTGLITFPLIILMTRWLKQQLLTRSDLLSPNRGAREALATIIGYVGFMLAAFISLLLAGVNFSGLTLIAGALSVGIGFGLQNIVSNFISGLILLIERPIKVGDRIVVGTLEGHVKKISIRSTQIRSTDQFSDIIVPNSQLIAERVTNLMLHDSEGRLSIPIGVAYGSDTTLVRQILLQTANENPAILPNRTEIWFKEFGESSLNFELRCIVKNIDQKYEITSYLLLAIDQEFRKHNIEIPFPQRDIHVYNHASSTVRT